MSTPASDRSGPESSAEPEGEVSEVSGMAEGDADLPIQPDQSVAGGPDDQSGADEGAQGPNANPNRGASDT